MLPRQARCCARSLTRVRRACVARGARGDCEEGDGENHQESVIGGGAPLAVFGGAKFVQGVFTAIE